jgi:PAS domain S-box-containing protein
MPDLILCDIAMPGLSGYEVYNSLQQITYTSVIPFIFVTAKTELEDIRTGLQLGADDYVTKPFNYEDLAKTIEMRLRKQEKLMKVHDEKFNALIQNANTGICIIQDDKIVFVNQKLTEILGFEKKELVGMNIVNIIYREDIKKLTHKITEAYEGVRKEFSTKFQAIKKDNALVQLEMQASMVPIKNRKSLVCSIFTQEDMAPAQLEKNYEKKSSLLIKISKREKEVLKLLAKGLSTDEIADELNISKRTVEGHRSNLISKTEAKNSVGLVIYAIKNALIEI